MRWEADTVNACALVTTAVPLSCQPLWTTSVIVGHRRSGSKSRECFGLLPFLPQFWTTAGGIIMCADSSMSDTLGIQPGDLVGRNFSDLCTDVEGVNK